MLPDDQKALRAMIDAAHRKEPDLRAAKQRWLCPACGATFHNFGCAMCDLEKRRKDAEIQVRQLRAALSRVLDAREKEAKDNISGAPRAGGRRNLAAMTEASNAERDARALLASLKTPNA